MPTIEFILRSKFDATGANQALAKWRELAQFAAGATPSGNEQTAQSLTQATQAAAQLQQQLAGVAAQVQNVGRQSKLSFEEGIFKSLEARGVRGLNQTIEQLKTMASVSQQLSQRSFDSGMISRGVQFATETEKIEGIIRRLGGASQETGTSLMDMIKGVLSPLNAAGFALFLITSNLRTLQIVAEAAFNALLEGATRTDVLLSYNRLTEQAGINTQGLANRLQEASDGLITMQTAQASVNRAIIAGVPQLANASPKLLEMAKAIAVATGNIDDLNHIYSTLMLGILRGSPQLIDNANIYLKLGEVNATYAESIGKTVEEMTVHEKKLATLTGVLEHYDEVMALVGGDVEGHATVWVSLKNEMEETKGVALSLIEAVASANQDFLGQPLSAWTSMESVKKDLVELAKLSVALVYTIELPFNVLVRAIDESLPALAGFSAAIQAIQDRDMMGLQAAIDATQAAISGFDASTIISEEWANTLDETIAKFAELDAIAGQVTAGLSEGFRDSGIREGLLGPLDEVIASLRYIGSAEYELQQDLVDNWQKYHERIAEIEADFGERIIELREARNERLKDLEEQLAEQQEEINEDLAEALEDITTDANRDTERANAEYHKDLEKAEEDHQKRINDIMRRFELARLRALIDRDARALFEAERKRDEDLEAESQSFEERMQDLADEHAEELQRIEEQEERKRQEAIEAAEKRRQDAIEAYEKQRQDAIEAYEEQLEDAQEALQEQREQAKKAAKDRENDLKESYAERNYIAEAGEKLRIAIEARSQLESEENMFDFFLGLKDQVKDYYDFLEEYRDYEFPFAPDPDDLPQMPGDKQSPGTGTNPPGQSPCASGEGGTVPCNTPDQLYTCGDGSKYVCVGGKWRRTYGGGDSFAQTGGTGGVITGGGRSGSGTGGATGQRVTIHVTGDKTLEEIFRAISYDAMIEIIS